MLGDGNADAVDRLSAAFAEALAEQRHVLLNMGSCDYLDPEVVGLIAAEKEHMAESELEVMQFGASGVLRPIIGMALAEPADEKADRRVRQGSPVLTPTVAPALDS